MKISIGNDHAGPDYKKAIVQFLEEKGHTIYNHGTDTFDSVDYPDFGHLVAHDVATKKSDFGIVICGSGNGIAMTVNKHQDIRAALCWTKEIAALNKQASVVLRTNTLNISKEILQKKLRADGHRRLTLLNGTCSGLTDAEYNKVVTRQKSNFAKSKKFTHNRMWQETSKKFDNKQLKLIIKTL